MFSVYCPRHDSEVLLDEHRILDLDNTGDGVTVRWRCWCGHVGRHDTGRTRRSLAAIA